MAGIYIHIPFCKQACYYCNFHFSTSSKLKDEIIKSICQEISWQKNYLGNRSVETIYFGGGTPSILSIQEIESILQQINKNFAVANNPEITIEANPDDLNKEKLHQLFHLGINRLSIGVQSFDDKILKLLNRAHNSHEAFNCIKEAQNIGFTNLSVDLIYNIVEDEHHSVKNDLVKITNLHPNHISAYSLTIEPGTAFGSWKKSGKISEVSEDYAAEQFNLVVDTLEKNGFQQYEISNFARDQYYSKHNTSYWSRVPYLGIGPAAHSFNGVSRQFNIANNAKYIRSVADGKIPFELEILDDKAKVNEQIFTGLRTIWGCDVKSIKETYGYDIHSVHQKYFDQLNERGLIEGDHQILKLSRSGRILADEISAQLMWV